MIQQTLNELETGFKKVLEAFERDLAKVRTGRANLAILDGIRVEYYGVPTPLNQVAALAVPDPRMITISPWEKKLIGPIEKALSMADIGLTPTNDGALIRLTIPALTTERRKDLAKQVKRLTEECKVSLRNVRRDARAKLEKAEGLPEDDQKRGLDKIDKETDRIVKDAEAIGAKKEKEIMEI
jgi:ribosome recycling factor